LKLTLAVRKRARDLVQLLRAEGDRAVGDDLGRAPAAQRDVEVGGGDAELAAPGLREDVGKDGDGVLPLYDPLHERELLHQVGLPDEDLHHLSSPGL